MNKRIVTVQDISCLGQCSITVALPILSSLGLETAILPSAILSTHTGGFQNPYVQDLTETMPKITAHWEREGLLFDGIYSGYIGNPKQFETILELRRLLKPEGIFAVDPAMADKGKLYKGLSEETVKGMQALVSKAQVILPNITEACLLLGDPYEPQLETYESQLETHEPQPEPMESADNSQSNGTDFARTQGDRLQRIRSMAKRLSQLGPRYSIITGVPFSDWEIGAICYDKEKDEFTEATARRFPNSYHGTGDMFASVCIGNLIQGKNVSQAMEQAATFVSKAIENTVGDPDHPYGVHFEQVLAEPAL